MDARSIAATAANGGILTSAADLDVDYSKPAYTFNGEIYKNRVYSGYKKAVSSAELRFGPNIADWPEMPGLNENLLLKVAAFITDEVTTTDELIPSGETSSYRSNPMALAQFTLSRKDPCYVKRAEAAQKTEIFGVLKEKFGASAENTGVGSLIYANKPGDGSAREQAASCQKVLGGRANIAHEYATKRYRSNLVNWGMLPFIIKGEPPFGLDDCIFIPDAAKAVKSGADCVDAYVVGDDVTPFKLYLPDMTDDEREIVSAGCLINYYR
jgi:aconitate hydratase